MATSVTERPQADVEVRVPADSAFVSVLRSTAAGVASRLDFDLSTIEDLRVAVGEACALALPQADEGSSLRAEFHLAPRHLTVRVSVTGTEVQAPDRESFAWQVLDTLASGATTEVDGGLLAIVLGVGGESLPG
ncbi:ATP-binding protein [Nocardioides sp. GXQ0305]|uniref:ATP-binding protein n=1 Tax=Nocardioides sp. GXQ0305 TaxID=3423912 RepID=UPI003D7C413A